MDAINPLAQDSLAAKAADALSEEILSGRLTPGQRVDLGRYAATWNVSITPLRDAAKQLEAVGLVHVLPRRGVFVTELDAKELKDIFDVRIALECTAIRLATPSIPKREAERALRLYCMARDTTSDAERKELLPKIDLLIHTLGQEYCGNPRLQKLMDGMRDLIKWSQRTIIAKLNEPFLATLPEHIAICAAVCRRDADQAAALMQEHLENTFSRIQEFLGQKKGAQPDSSHGRGG